MTMKIYFARHQATGVLWQYPFSSPITSDQIAALEKLCFQQHGATHPKTGESYWMKTVAIDVLDNATVPAVPERSLSTVSSAVLPEVTVDAVGHVRNPR